MFGSSERDPLKIQVSGETWTPESLATEILHGRTGARAITQNVEEELSPAFVASLLLNLRELRGAFLQLGREFILDQQLESFGDWLQVRLSEEQVKTSKRIVRVSWGALGVSCVIAILTLLSTV